MLAGDNAALRSCLDLDIGLDNVALDLDLCLGARSTADRAAA
jgi:hypothetical protein